MKKLIKMYNEKFGDTLGVIDDDFNKEQMYRIYYFIKNNCDDEAIQNRIKMINLDKPKTLEQQLTKLESENNKGGTVDPTIKADINNVKDDVNKLNAQYKDIASKTITTEERTKLTNLENYDDTTVKANIQNVQQQVNNLVLGAVGDGNNAEVVQARGEYSTLNERLDDSLKYIKIINNIAYSCPINTTLTPNKEGFGLEIFSGAIKNNKNTLYFKYTPQTGKNYIINDIIYNEGNSVVYREVAYWFANNIIKLNSVHECFLKLDYSKISIGNGYTHKMFLFALDDETNNIEISNIVLIDDDMPESSLRTLIGYYGQKEKYPKLDMPVREETTEYVDNKINKLNLGDINCDFQAKIPTLYNEFKNKQIESHIEKSTTEVPYEVNLYEIYLNKTDKRNIKIFYNFSNVDGFSLERRTLDEDGHTLTRDLVSTLEDSVGYFSVDLTTSTAGRFAITLVATANLLKGTKYNIDINSIVIVPYETEVDNWFIQNSVNYYGEKAYYNYYDFNMYNNLSIQIIGDSIGSQIGSMLAKKSSNRDNLFRNLAIGGETVLDTMGRLGAIPYMIMPCTIPQEGEVEVTLLSSLYLDISLNETTGAPTYSNGYISNYSTYGINPANWNLVCTINDIEGELIFNRSNVAKFKRKTKGAAVVIDRPTNVIPSYVNRKNPIIAFMGTNSGWDSRFFTKAEKGTATYEDADNLVNIYKKIAQYIMPQEYLFLGFYCTAQVSHLGDTNDWWNYFENKMTKEFGHRYFSVRRYLRTLAYKDAGLGLTKEDVAYLKKGEIPYQVITGDSTGGNPHMTEKIVGACCNTILKYLKEIGIIDSFETIDISSLSSGASSTNPDDYV